MIRRKIDFLYQLVQWWEKSFVILRQVVVTEKNFCLISFQGGKESKDKLIDYKQDHKLS